MREEILRLEGVRTEDINGAVFSDISLQIFKGDIVGLVCDNLSCLRLIQKVFQGGIAFYGGKIFYRGERKKYYEIQSIFERNIFFVEENKKINQSLRVIDYIFIEGARLPKEIRSIRKITAAVTVVMEKYKCFNIDKNEYLKNLSVLEMCQLSIIKAILCGSELIVLSELSSFMNEDDIEWLMKIVLELKKSGISFVMIDFDERELYKYSDSIVLLIGGRTGFWIDTNSSPKLDIYKIFFDKGYIREKNNKLDISKGKSDIVFQLKEMEWGILKNISLSIYKGEIVSLSDRGGYYCDIIQGLIEGKIQCNHGEMLISGFAYTPRSIIDSLKAGICIIKENPIEKDGMLFAGMTVLENLTIFMAYKVGNIMQKKYQESLTKECNAFFGYDIANIPVKLLSDEEKQRLVYYKTYLYSPKLIVCIRPFNTDMYLREITKNMILKCADKGISVMIFTSDTREAYDISNEIKIIKDGTIINN